MVKVKKPVWFLGYGYVLNVTINYSLYRPLNDQFFKGSIINCSIVLLFSSQILLLFVVKSGLIRALTYAPYSRVS